MGRNGRRGGIRGRNSSPHWATQGRYPDLIIADYRLGEGELGTGVIERLRDEFGMSIPALLVSGDASAEAIANMRASIQDVLLKPVVPEQLRLTAERLLGPACAAAPATKVSPRAGTHFSPPPSSGKEYQKKSAPQGAPEDRPGSG